MFPLYAAEKSNRIAVVTLGLIAANVVVFVAELLYTNGLDSCLSSQLFYNYGLVPYSVVNGVQLSYDCAADAVNVVGSSPAVYLTPLTSMFLHAGFEHIIGNMWFLFVFGRNIEMRFGRAKYLGCYLASGLAGALAIILSAYAVGPPDIYIPGIGASGAISGVMAAYLVFYPKSQIITLAGYVIIPVRAFWFIGGWFLLQVIYQLGGLNSGVAYAAHIGGFLMGLLLAFVVKATTKSDDETEGSSDQFRPGRLPL
ncbi:MAG TPA: rhomboid family intramembrane serine protease [Conexivisphaerales archaeon]|nr:rhomboid family intramembrane serine protease [Conexivisphaerales archaeon]